MKEVEILVKVFNRKSTVLKALKQFKFLGEKETIDDYYYDPLRKNLTPQKNKYPKEWFRIRKKNNKYFITYKKDIYEKSKWLYSNEEETEIKDHKIITKIIESLGLKKLVTIDNIKHTFKTSKYEIVFEEVKGLGLFLEVERLKVGNHENINIVKAEIQEFINSLNIKVSPELNLGKPELMLKSKE